jgi:3-oxoacyl-[acyl-carrier-protein] synthase-1
MSSFWNIFSRQPTTSTSSTTLAIRSAGLCCAVGYNLAAAACAIRANMDHFQQSEFQANQRDKVLVARLPDTDLWGQTRLARWIELAIADCLSGVSALDTTSVPLLWLAPEPERSGGDADWYAKVFTQAVQQLNKQFHPSSGVLPLGRAGLAGALQQATDLFEQSDCQYVLLVGADTYLNATMINYYLHAERLQVPGNSDGFIPGEAAAAVLLQKLSTNDLTHAEMPSESNMVHIRGFGIGNEAGRPDGSVPSRAQGLTQAVRTALGNSRLDYAEMEFRIGDQNGEAFFARESANAMTRVAPVGGQKLPLLTLADCLGEVGAATGPAMLAYLSKIMPHDTSPGHHGLLHLAADNGLRCAVVLQYPSA